MMRFNLRFSQCVLSLAFTRSLADRICAADWPQFRGPHRDGISPDKGLLDQWPSGGPPLLWKKRGIGSGFSSVSIAGSRIFTMGDAADTRFIYALDMSGNPLWSATVGQPGGDHPGTRCTPTVDGELVFALGQFGDLVCVEARTGK